MSKIKEELSNHFAKLRLLGEGATSSAFYGERKKDGLPCVVKVFQRGLDEAAGEQPLARFEREVKALASLSHRAIVKIVEWGKTASFPYLVLEYKAASSLEEFLKKRAAPLPWPQTVKIMATLAQALAHAHKNKIIHRDIKPANILLLKDGSPMLIDFGLVRSGFMQTYRTATGVILGSPAYMAPELFGTERADESTDLYSLAVVTYEMLTGEKAFRGTLSDIIRQKMSKGLSLASTVGLPPALAAIVNGLLRQRKDRLKVSAQELAHRLANISEKGSAVSATVTQQIGRKEKAPIAPATQSSKASPSQAVAADKGPKGRNILPYLIGAALMLVIAFYFWPAPSVDLTILDLHSLGKLVKEDGLMAGFTINSQAKLEDIGRLYRGQEFLKKGKRRAAFLHLFDLLQQRGFQTVLEGSKIVELVLQGAKGARYELEVVDSFGHTLIGKAKRHLQSGEAEKVKSVLLAHYASRPKKSEVWGQLCSLLHRIEKGRFENRLDYELAGELLSQLAAEKESNVVVAGIAPKKLNKDGFPFLVAVHALEMGSERWRKEHGWKLFAKVISATAPLPEARYIKEQVFFRLIKNSPSFRQIAKIYEPYLERLLTKSYFHTRRYSDVRWSLFACHAANQWGRQDYQKEAHHFQDKCLKKRICSVRHFARHIKAEDFNDWFLAEGWFLLAEPTKSWHYLKNLLHRAFELPTVACDILGRVAELAPHDKTPKRLKTEIVNELKSLCKKAKHPERRALYTSTLLVIAARTVIKEPVKLIDNSDAVFTKIGQAFLAAGSLSPQNIPDVPQGLEASTYGMLLCATGTSGACVIPLRPYHKVSRRLVRILDRENLLPGQTLWLLRYLARFSEQRRQHAALRALLPLLQVRASQAPDAVAFKTATAFWHPKDKLAIYLTELTQWRKQLPIERRLFFEVDFVYRLCATNKFMLLWCKDLKSITDNLDLLLSFYTKGKETINTEYYHLLARLLDMLGLCGRLSDQLTSQQKRTDEFGDVPYFRNVAKMVIRHSDVLLKKPDLPPNLRLQIQFRKMNALIDALKFDEVKKSLDAMNPNEVAIGFRWHYWYEMARWAENQHFTGKQIHSLITKAEQLPFVDVTRTNVVKIRTAFRL